MSERVTSHIELPLATMRGRGRAEFMALSLRRHVPDDPDTYFYRVMVEGSNLRMEAIPIEYAALLSRKEGCA